MFAGNQNVFSDKNNNNLFNTANEGLNEINDEWFRAKKLSINKGETRFIYTCFFS